MKLLALEFFIIFLPGSFLRGDIFRRFQTS
jgi:hypothetical protein